MTLEEFQNEFYCKFTVKESICDIIIIKTEVFQKADEILKITIRDEKKLRIIGEKASQSNRSVFEQIKEYQKEQFIEVSKRYQIENYLQKVNESFQNIEETTYRKEAKNKNYLKI